MRRVDRRSLPLIVAAVLCLTSVMLVPEWERRLHAEDYVDLDDDLRPGKGESERDRKVIEQQLGAQQPTFRRGFFVTLHHDTSDSSEGPTQLSSDEPGFIAGFDYQYSDRLLLGWAAGFNIKLAGLDDAAGRETQDTTTYTYRTGPYLKYEGLAPWYVYAIALGALLDVRNERRGTIDTLHSDTTGGQLDATLVGGYDFVAGPLRFGPVGGVTYQGLWLDGYTERGDIVDRLKVEDVSLHQIGFRVGGNATYGIPMPWGILAPQVRLVGVYEDLVDRGPVRSSFVQCLSGSCEQRALVQTPDRWFMELGLGLTIGLPNRWTLSAYYQDSFLRERTQQSSVSITLRKQF